MSDLYMIQLHRLEEEDVDDPTETIRVIHSGGGNSNLPPKRRREVQLQLNFAPLNSSECGGTSPVPSTSSHSCEAIQPQLRLLVCNPTNSLETESIDSEESENESNPKRKHAKLSKSAKTKLQPQPAKTSKLVKLSSPSKRFAPSIIWKLCKKRVDAENARVKAVCNLCKFECDTTKITSNCRKHLQFHHPIEFEAAEAGSQEVSSMSAEELLLQNESQSQSQPPPPPSNGNQNSEVTVNEQYLKTKTKRKQVTVNEESVKMKQLALRSAIHRSSEKKPYSTTHKRKKLLDQKLIMMICEDFQPFSIVDDPGFIRFCYALDECYTLPCHTTVTNRLLDSCYDRCKHHLDEILKECEFITITFDTWTSVAHLNYLVVTGHFVNDEKIQKCLLGFLESSESHAAADLATLIQENIISQYSNLKFSCAVTDNAANVVAVCKNLNIPNNPCFLHTVQLVVNNAIRKAANVPESVWETDDSDYTMDELNSSFNPLIYFFRVIEEVDEANEQQSTVMHAINKSKKIVAFFNRSSKANSLLKKELELRKKPYSSLIQDVLTGWNSTYAMLLRIYDAMDSINVVLFHISKHGLTLLSSEEVQSIPEILKLLKPFADLNDIFSTDSYPTISLIIPFSTGLRIEIQLVTMAYTATENLKVELLEKWKQYLLPYEKRTITSWATLLDVRFNSPSSFSTYANYTAANDSLKEELIKMRTPKNIEREASSPPETPISQAVSTYSVLKHILKKRGPIASASKQKINPRAEVIVLLNAYMDVEPNVNMEAENSIKKSIQSNFLIKFWNDYNQFEEMQILAKKILFSPSSSASSERSCSTASNIISNRRSTLTAEHAAKILYINKNKHFIND